MKNLNDIFSGAVLLCLCAVGAYEVSASIAPSDGEVVGADALPTLALGGMALATLPWVIYFGVNCAGFSSSSKGC
jgi:hypothetical protein